MIPRRIRAASRMAGLLAALVLALVPHAGTRAAGTDAGDPLGPYRALALSAEGHALLESARAVLRLALDATAEGREALARETDPHAVDIPWPAVPVPLYVSLVEGRATRACVGSDLPLGDTLEEAVRRLAVSALSADRRRPPVRREELDRLRVVVSFAGPVEAVADPMQVNPARQALLVRTGRGSIAFLPGEAKTVAWALREARRLGVLQRARDAEFLKFETVVLAETRAPVEGRRDDRAQSND